MLAIFNTGCDGWCNVLLNNTDCKTLKDCFIVEDDVSELDNVCSKRLAAFYEYNAILHWHDTEWTSVFVLHCFNL